MKSHSNLLLGGGVKNVCVSASLPTFFIHVRVCVCGLLLKVHIHLLRPGGGQVLNRAAVV